MNTISKTYVLYFRLKNNPNYQFTKCGLCFNLKTGREIKKVYKSRCIGYNIKSKFKALNTLRKDLEKIPTKEILPF